MEPGKGEEWDKESGQAGLLREADRVAWRELGSPQSSRTYHLTSRVSLLDCMGEVSKEGLKGWRGHNDPPPSIPFHSDDVSFLRRQHRTTQTLSPRNTERQS